MQVSLLVKMLKIFSRKPYSRVLILPYFILHYVVSVSSELTLTVLVPFIVLTDVSRESTLTCSTPCCCQVSPQI
jgi:hypothetical protein